MEHLKAREMMTVYCNGCLQRYAVIFEPDFAKGEEDQVKPQAPIICPFCAGEDVEQEGEKVTEVRAYNADVLKGMCR